LDEYCFDVPKIICQFQSLLLNASSVQFVLALAYVTALVVEVSLQSVAASQRAPAAGHTTAAGSVHQAAK
jgi:hypothetical protein